MTRVLFICGKNRWRSPTAKQVFSGHPGVECLSAGLSRDSDTPVTRELVEWAEIVFVMEKVHRAKLSARFGGSLGGRRVVCLGIADNYRFMDPALVELLRKRVTPQLG